MTESTNGELYDIVIVGAGPAGLMLATCLVRWGWRIKHIDNRTGPTATGRADAIQPRYFEVLRELGLKASFMAHDPRRIYTSAFWQQSEGGGGGQDGKRGAEGVGEQGGKGKGNRGIVRTSTARMCPDVVEARYPFLTVLHQGLIERVFLDAMASHDLRVDRPWTLESFDSSNQDHDANSDHVSNPDDDCDDYTKTHPVTVHLRQVDGSARQTVRAKYLFSGEGARSSVRQMLGIPFASSDATPYIWGVIDGLLDTDFPDVELLCVIHSQQGPVLLIPRENNLTRIYVLLAAPDDPSAAAWDVRRPDAVQQIQAKARAALHPYRAEWELVDWFSVYPIKQGIAGRYTLDERVFLGGDACHVHSPKLAQGMNTALFDAHNLAWKLHAVNAGFANRRILATYEAERRAWATTLIAYDRRYSAGFSRVGSAAVKKPSSGEGKSQRVDCQDGKSPNGESNEKSDDNKDTAHMAFTDSFKTRCSFASGHGVFYHPNTLIWSPSHPSAAASPLFSPPTCTLTPGHQFIAATLTRLVDAHPVPLDQAIPLNGSFRIYVFVAASRPALASLAASMARPASFHARVPDATARRHRHCSHSRFFTVCTVFAAPRAELDIVRDTPPLLAAYRYHVYADDLPDARVPGARASAHAKIGLRPESEGVVVVVRPDGFVGAVVRLVDGSGTGDALNAYFDAFCASNPSAVSVGVAVSV